MNYDKSNPISEAGPTRVPAITVQLGEQEKRLNRLQDIVSELHHRLAPILDGGFSERPPATKGVEPVVSCEVGGRLRGVNMGLAAILEELESILRRVEI